jgi:hypothetical protein
MRQIINLIGMIILAVGPNYGATFLGYMLNAASWGYWPVLYVCNPNTYQILPEFFLSPMLNVLDVC